MRPLVTRIVFAFLAFCVRLGVLCWVGAVSLG